MRVFRIRGSALGAPFPRKNAFPVRPLAARKISTPLFLRRHESTSSVGQWTPHSLDPSTISGNQSPIISTPRKDEAKKQTAYIALGSNLGDRIDWIEKACNEMSKRGIKVNRTSSLWETEPMYVTDQDSFVNGACEVSQLPSEGNGGMSFFP